MNNILVTKRDGSCELFDPEKLHRILFWATEDITGVSVSQIETKSQLQIYQGIPTSEIHEIMIATSHELISTDTPNYQWVAARLRLFQLRKETLGQFEPWPVKKLVERNVELGFYTKELLEWYNDDEFEQMDSFINHNRDFDYAFAGMEQFHGKYLVQNRVTKQVYETPQYLNMLVSASFFYKYPKSIRMSYVKDMYDAISQNLVSLPTPVMSGLRTGVKQYSSCVLIECGDSLPSINATSNAIVDYISRKAGIGIEGGHIRALNSEIRGGNARHTGVQPFYRLFQSAVKSCSQGGVRGGAATVYVPIWHLEIENILTLKSNSRTEETAVRHMDYGVQFCELFYKRLIKGENISLFSPHQVKDMHKAFFDDQDEFERLYAKYEMDDSIMKSVIPAVELFSLYHKYRSETGRIYKLNVDHANIHGSFIPEVAPIRMSNLCVTGDTLVNLRVEGETFVKPIMELVNYIHDGVAVHDGVTVLSKNIDNGEIEWKQVTAFAMTSSKAKVMRITDSVTGKSIKCTPDHEIYTKNRGYVMAKDLTEEDVLEMGDNGL